MSPAVDLPTFIEKNKKLTLAFTSKNARVTWVSVSGTACVSASCL